MKHLIQQIKGKSILLILCLIVIAVLAAIAVKHKQKDDLLPVALTAIKTTGGWGYQIAVDGKTFIRQEYIPAIEGRKSFESKEDALLVGRNAITKLKQGKLPSITVAELKEWGVIKSSMIQ